MSPDQTFALSRRAFATGMTGSLAVLSIGDPVAASALAAAPRYMDMGDADMRDAALRGLARASDVGDPVLAAKAEAALARLESSDPEGALLVRVYRAYDVEAAIYRYGKLQDASASAPELTTLHSAVQECRAVSFRYTDLAGEVTMRTVLPLAIVHPPQGIKLLAWCEKRGDIRQFFVRALSELTIEAATFRDRRMPLLWQLADGAASRA